MKTLTTVKNVYDFINSIAPFNTAMDFDNCGLLVGDIEAKVNKIMVTLDVTNEVIKETKENNVDLILSHHPVIFKPIKNLMSNSIPYLLAKNGINVLCAHTNLDMANCGVNYCLASRLKLKNLRSLSSYKKKCFNKIVVFVPCGYEEKIIEAMSKEGAGKLGEYSKCSFKSKGVGSFLCDEDSSPFIGTKGKYESADEIRIEMICPEEKTNAAVKAMLKVHPYEEPAYDIFEDKAVESVLSLGLIGDLDKFMSDEQFAVFVKEQLQCSGVRYTKCSRKIKTVGLCSGAGGDLVPDAIRCKVDAFVTGEIKHNRILELNSEDISLVDAGHFKTENVYVDYMVKMLSENFEDVYIEKSSRCSDNIMYV